jgi:hypothetical protein
MEQQTTSEEIQKLHELEKQVMEAVRAELRNLMTIGRLSQRVEIRLPIENLSLQNLSVMYLAPKRRKAL